MMAGRVNPCVFCQIAKSSAPANILYSDGGKEKKLVNLVVPYFHWNIVSRVSAALFIEQVVCFPLPLSMVEFFFSCNTTHGSDTMMLLTGPPSCGSTSLLFQFAFNCAMENSGSVVFICNRQIFEANPPLLPQERDSTSEVLQRVQMKYVENDKGIKKYFAAFHLHDVLPSAVIIDGFGDFFDDSYCQNKYGNPRGRDLAMARVLALCRDAITQANERLQPLRTCKLLLSDVHQGESPRSLFIYKRWIPSIFAIHKEDEFGSFTLKESNISGRNKEKQMAAKYSIALQRLVLEEIFYQ